MNLTLRRRPMDMPTMINGTPSVGRLFSEMLSDPFFNLPLELSASPVRAVPLDIVETEKAYIVKADLPGFSKENVEIELVDKVLTIKGEITEEVDEKKEEKFLRRERRLESVVRSIAIPEGVLESEVTAEFNNGVVHITLPKAPTILPKKIAIK
mgnify:CR=1 FL=1